MEEINIQAHGFELDKKIRMHIRQHLHNVFGIEKYLVHKIIIKLFDENDLNNTKKCCQIRIDVRNQPPIITELKSLDLFTAIDLAIERTNLKASHRFNGEHAIQKRLKDKRSALTFE